MRMKSLDLLNTINNKTYDGKIINTGYAEVG